MIIRFGHDWDSQCMTMDETLYSVAERVQNFAVIYLVDITEVPDFNKVRRFQVFVIRYTIASHRCTNCMIHALLCSSIGTLKLCYTSDLDSFLATKE